MKKIINVHINSKLKGRNEVILQLFKNYGLNSVFSPESAMHEV